MAGICAYLEMVLICMTTWQLPKWVLAACCGCLLLTGCATTGSPLGSGKRFQDAAATDLVLRFNRWDTIHMVRPETREGGFMPILDRTGVEHELRTRAMGHNLAVVMIGFLHTLEQEAQLARDWTALLGGHGFRRVVLVRGGWNAEIDGLPIVHDSSIAAAYDRTVTVAAAFADHPAAARADVAHPPGD